ncbi:MAG: hypothetical protein KDB18_11305 [Salinibacterium sp.]|nr:hypothetical protein [Salinibacterium sp.]
MSPTSDDFHSQVADLFEAVLEMSPEDRLRYLDDQEISSDVRQELEELLSHESCSLFTEVQLGPTVRTR